MAKKNDRTFNDVILNGLLAYSSDLVIVVSSDFCIHILNKSCENFFQWPKDKTIGKHFLTFCQAQGNTSPIPENFFKKPSTLNFNLNCKGSTGKEYNINWTIAPLHLPDGQTGALIIGRDIEFKKNNIAYYLNGIMDAIPGCLFWKDCDGHYLGCNKLTAELAGLASPNEIIGKTDEELWGEQAASLSLNDQKVITQGETILVEETLKTADNQWMNFTGVKMPLRDENNKIIGLIGNSLDITELKKTQEELKVSMRQAEAANVAKSEFIRNMEHQLRTPFSGVYSIVEMLCMEETDPEKKELLNLTYQSAKEFLELLNNIIEFSRNEVEGSALMHRKFNFKELVLNLATMEKAAAVAKNIDLIVNYADDLPDMFLSDPNRIKRLILSLLDNAIKFTHQGHVSVDVRLAKKVDEKSYIVQIIVEDTGIGITENQQQYVYEKFFRVHPANHNTYKGAGLGLYTVKQIVDELEGEVEVHSTPEKGTTFICTLPLKKSLLD